MCLLSSIAFSAKHAGLTAVCYLKDMVVHVCAITSVAAQIQSDERVHLELLGQTLDGHDLDLLRIGAFSDLLTSTFSQTFSGFQHTSLVGSLDIAHDWPQRPDDTAVDTLPCSRAALDNIAAMPDAEASQ